MHTDVPNVVSKPVSDAVLKSANETVVRLGFIFAANVCKLPRHLHTATHITLMLAGTLDGPPAAGSPGAAASASASASAAAAPSKKTAKPKTSASASGAAGAGAGAAAGAAGASGDAKARRASTG